MTVYLLIYDMGYDGQQVEEAFLDQSKANERCDDLNKQYQFVIKQTNYYKVQEIEVK